MRRRDIYMVLTVAAGSSVLAVLAACGPPAGTVVEGVPDKINYNWDVRPILSQNCFACHGNQKQEAGLRLDIQKNAYDPLPETPGKRADSSRQTGRQRA